MILVTGAAGKTGQAVIQALARRGVAIRAFVYRAEQVAQVQPLGAAQVVVGHLENESDFQRALVGVNAVYLICPNMHPHEQELGQLAIAVAQQAGLAHFVYHSVLHPQVEAMPHHWHKLRVEEKLFEAGLNFTILQPAAYMQNVLAGWKMIVEQGLYRVPYPPQTRLSLVDLYDVAEVAATVLSEPGHAGAIYELAGPDILSQIEIATILSELLGRPVQAEQISFPPLPELVEGSPQAAGLGTYQVETLLKMFRYYQNYHFYGNAKVLSWLLGRPPTTFRAFAERAMTRGPVPDFGKT